MARFDRLTVYNTMLAAGLVPLFYSGDIAEAKAVAAACVEGGAPVLEFTNRGERALSVFGELVSANPKLILGVGSVTDAPTAALFIAHGANFVVGPVFNPEVARLCNRRKIAYLPGCGTVSEIAVAEEMGAEIVKVFPGESIGGPGFIKAVLGPMPWSRLMPTGGVEATAESIGAWIKAGAVAVGLGSGLIRKDWLAAKNYDAIRDCVKQCLAWVAEARGR
ncbi:MAG: bifunctional 4-hydroxy-2-oxoglutarate aldolase/2-dehydro-3-deoxy-phosphogluconate aldolase [Candidatus Roseilinea sp.]|uniref:bifunctional 4-hydroxy-2-oxoglutarate aldolase/2-dehydro-3-deoxy-phosphogluconate aldolase n=1 Tax=Candidatus Roseilinea sp. TaxID=2838777 RepID=UPI004049D5D3